MRACSYVHWNADTCIEGPCVHRARAAVTLNGLIKQRIATKRQSVSTTKCCTAKAAQLSPLDIFQLASIDQTGLPVQASSIFSFDTGLASCSVSPALVKKFGREWKIVEACSAGQCLLVAYLARLSFRSAGLHCSVSDCGEHH